MIISKSTGTNYKVYFTNGKHEALSDTSKEKGGLNAGFRPHELLEASLACCINIWLKMYGEKNNIKTGEITVKVSINRTNTSETTFEYSIKFQNTLLDEEKQKLIKAAGTCPVHKTLSKKIIFRENII